MIDVPILVKDSLRDGRRLKNYRIEVLKKNYADVFDDVYTFTSSSLTYTLTAGGTFHLYSEDSTKAFETCDIVNPNGGGTYQIPCPVGEEITDVDIGSLGADVQIVINGLHTSSLILKIFIETRTEEVVDFTIDNNKLVSESVRIDERMCSGDTIKYGLCEGSSIEFQYFEKPNIKNKRIRAYVDVQYESGGSLLWHTIPMGYFTISQCPRQASTGIRKALGYNKLKSEYLDAPIKDKLQEIGSDQLNNDMISLAALQYWLLNGYQIQHQYNLEDEVEGQLYDVWENPISSGCNTYFRNFASNINWYLWSNSKRVTFENLDPTKIYVIEGLDTYWEQLNKEIDHFLEEQLKPVCLNDTYYQNIKTNFLNSGHMARTFGGTARYQIEGVTKEKALTNIMASTIINPGTAGQPYVYDGQGYVKGARYISGVKEIRFNFPYKIVGHNATTEIVSTTQTFYFYSPIYSFDVNMIKVYEMSDVNDVDGLVIDKNDIPDNTTLRDILNADYELKCQFGKLDRLTDLFSGVELNRSRLYPAETLYPADTLYPDGAQSSSFKSSYSKLWADEGNIQKWRNLVLRYKGLDENQQETEFEYTKEISASGTADYVTTDNWVLNNLIWTAADIETLATSMAGKMSNLQWFPFELWGAGLPYLETGDEIEITLNETTYPSYILQRQLGGIQNLQDTYINGSLEIF